MTPQFGDGRLSPYFWSKVSPEPNSGCWLWLGRACTTGYGQIKYNGKLFMSHRLAYEALVSEIPAELHLDHLCRVRWCVNPLHLEPVTCRENVVRGIGPTAQNARRTACSSCGGVFHPRKTRPGRECRLCKMGSARRSAQKKLTLGVCVKSAEHGRAVDGKQMCRACLDLYAARKRERYAARKRERGALLGPAQGDKQLLEVVS